MSGTWTTNHWLFAPPAGPAYDSNYKTGLDQVDARLSKVIYAGDPNYSTIAGSIAALNSAGTNCVFVIPPGFTETLTASLTANVNIQVCPMNGSLVTLGAYNFTVNNLFAGPYRWINKNSTGNFIPGILVSGVLSEWWGAKPDGSTASLTSIQAAIDTGVPLYLLNGTYLCAGAWNLNNNTTARATVIGMGPDNTIVQFSHTNAAGVIIDYLTSSGLPRVRLENIYFAGPGGSTAGNHGIYVPGGATKTIAFLDIIRCRVKDFGQDDIKIAGATGPVNISDCYLTDCGGNGLTVTNGTQDITINRGAIQGSIGGSCIALIGAPGTVGSFSAYEVDMEPAATHTQPVIYLSSAFGSLFSGCSLGSAATTLTPTNSMIYADSAVQGATFINLSVNATGGLNIFDTSLAYNTTIIGGSFVNSLTPPAGRGYFVVAAHDGLTVKNPLLTNFASKHGVVWDASSYGCAMDLTGVGVIRDPGLGTEITYSPKVLVLGKDVDWNPGTINDKASASTNITITGALTSHFVEVNMLYGGGSANPTGCIAQAYASNTNTVTLTLANISGVAKAFDAIIPFKIRVYRVAP